MTKGSPRYLRQELVEGIGPEGQARIGAARVAIVGSGALGCAIADQLARGGIGHLRIIDPDVPEISNLQRQVLIDEDDVASGTPKALAAAAKLRGANSLVGVDPIVARLEESNAIDLLSGSDLVMDGTDNFPARYLIDRTVRGLGIPYVFGGVLAASGMTFPVLPDGPCLGCAIGPMPPEGSVPTTEEEGILCSTVAAIASLQVVTALKIICGHQVAPRLAVVDLWDQTMRSIAVERDPSCKICG